MKTNSPSMKVNVLFSNLHLIQSLSSFSYLINNHQISLDTTKTLVYMYQVISARISITNIFQVRHISVLASYIEPSVMLTPYTLKRPFNLALVRSEFVYGSHLWRPQFINDIVALERIQKFATKFVLNNYSMDYKSRLVELKILPLMYFFELAAIVFFLQSIKNTTTSFDISNYILV